MIILDPLLSLMATRGGIISRPQFCVALEELRLESNCSLDPYAATNALRALQYLGHIDEAESGKFILASAYWARLPRQNPVKAVLCGCQLSALDLNSLVQVEQHTFSLFSSFFSHKTVTISSNIPSELESIAGQTGIPFSAKLPAWELAYAGEDTEKFKSAIRWNDSGMVPGYAQKFDPDALIFLPSKNEQTNEFTLWRWQGSRSQWQFAATESGKFTFLQASDIALAKHVAVYAADRNWIKYNPAAQKFSCPLLLPPPNVLARSLTLCRGKFPVIEKLGKKDYFVWKDVPPAIGYQICERLTAKS